MKNSEEINQAGIWMDHASAKLITLDGQITEIESENESHLRIPGESGSGSKLGNLRSSNNEYQKHNKENDDLRSFFDEVAEKIKPYSQIVVFGPTTAPVEFFNYVTNKNKQLSGKLTINTSDYLTNNQLIEYVKNHYNFKHVL